MPKYDRDGNPLEDQGDPYPIDPAASRNALTGGVQGITDPSTKTSAPDPNSPAEIARANGIYGPGGTAFNKPSPTSTWNPTTEAWNPTAPATTAATDPWSVVAAKYGLTDGGRGSGFADKAYWLEHPDQIANGRLEADMAGTGSDQPTGTPGSGPWSNSGRNAGGAGASMTTAPVSAGSAITASVGPSQPTIDYNAQIRKILLDQISGLGAPTTADSPEVAPAISAFNNQSQRDQTTNRDALAERFYASGEGGQALDSGGFNTSVQQGLEKSAGDRANFTGSTILNVANQKRQQLQQMLQTATSAGLTDAAQQIQAKIAELDASLRQQGITNQAGQFQQSLAQQNSQFGDSLGMTYAQLLAQQNRDTLLAGLNG